MPGRRVGLDDARLTKRSFHLGVALFAVGALGELAGPAVLGPMPGWERTAVRLGSGRRGDRTVRPVRLRHRPPAGGVSR